MINLFLALIKWPLALLMVLLIVPSWMTIEAMISARFTDYLMMWFVLPLLIMTVTWLFVPALSGTFLAIMEHELTHMIFAILTGHKPVDLEVKQNKGGHFSFVGKGNWLIALAPYFFPTFAVVVMLSSLIYQVMDRPLPDVYWAVFGAMTGYHLASTILEIHPAQTDFKSAGYIFTILFLPGMNLIMYGLLIAYACMGWAGVPVFLKGITYNAFLLAQQFMNV